MQRVVEAAGESDRDVSGPRSLMRVLGAFDLLSRSPRGMGLSEMSAVLSTPKSSLLSLLRPLLAEGYLRHDGSQYQLGDGAFRFFAGIMSAWNFSKQIRPFMEELSMRTEETVLLGVLTREAGVVTYVEIIDSPHPVRYQIPAGTTRPLYASSVGRLLLAYSPVDWQEEYLDNLVIKTKTEAPITKVWLRKTLQNIRRDGVSWSIDHYMDGLASVVAPVLDGNGRCLCSLSIAGPSPRFKADLGKLISTVKEVAARASGIVGDVRLPEAVTDK